MTEAVFPRLVYIGDVPIAQTMSGSVTLWRLLQNYPPHMLSIFETLPSDPATRLPDVQYGRLSPFLSRLSYTRFTLPVTFLLLLTARLRASAIVSAMKRFKPEAVLTVAHGISWLAAAEVAKRLSIPLYLINHDCWFEMIDSPRVLQGWLRRQFATVYRQAKVRFCVSGSMAQYYRSEYGAEGIVLYPGRASDCPTYSSWPGEHVDRGFTLAYAGGIFDGCADVLARVADELSGIDGTLLVFSRQAEDSPVRRKLAGLNIVWRNFVPADQFVSALRAHADALLVIREREMGLNAVMSFSSKIVDYTATGLPMLVYAPLDSATAAWISSNEAALLVEEGDMDQLRTTLRRIATNAALRKQLGEAALIRGEAYFSYEAVSRQFFAAFSEEKPRHGWQPPTRSRP